MASKINICNIALSMLGAASISDLSEPSPEARACALHFDDTLHTLLRQHPWNWATVERALAPLDGVTAAEWLFVYAYPTDCLTAQRIVAPDSPRTVPYLVRAAMDNGGNIARVIVTDQADAVLAYTAAVKDLSVCDGEFLSALQHRLAAALCMTLTGKAERLGTLTQLADAALIRAKARDAGEGHDEEETLPDWLTVREG